MLGQLFDKNKRQIQSVSKTVQEINELESEIQDISYDQMREEVQKVRSELQDLVAKVPPESMISVKTFNRSAPLPPEEKAIHDKLLSFMPRFFAMHREVLRRKADRRHYDIQLTAGILLAQGQQLAEIKTGEGKTQMFQLPLFLYALAGRGAHLVTVNDYLARVGGEYAGHFASELGLTVGVITPEQAYKFVPDEKLAEVKGEESAAQREGQSLTISGMTGVNLVACSKHEAYRCDITYGTNNEFGFDYLRDNMAWNLKDMVQRELYFCVVDEADSILIDEARTPLIISAPAEASSDKYQQFARAVQELEEDKHYTIDYKTRSATLTEEGIDKAGEVLGVDNIWEDYAMAHHLENALKAKALFVKDDHYMVKGGEVLIVDQFTGRIMPGRRYSEGLHQAIEAKEGVDIKQESRTFATISFQNLFRLYKFLTGGSGTIETEKEEFFKIYALDTVVIPTNKPVIRDDARDLIYKNQEAKFEAVAQEVARRHKAGQPVLVGTTSIERSEIVSRKLDKLGVPHQVLNAKYHDREAQIVARAGEQGAVTVATNMAGRGTDIPLGEGVVELGGLAVIGTERHEARRIDNQLRGRAGRQGDPGFSRFYVAMDDMIMKMLGGEVLQRLMSTINVPDDQPIEMGLISKRIEDAQKRVEWANFDSRKSLVEYDDVMNQHREVFYARRYDFLLDAESALGNFPERVAKGLSKDDLQERVERGKQQMLAQLEEQLLMEEVSIIASEQFAGKDHLDEDGKKSLVAKMLDMADDQDIAEVVDGVRANELVEYFQKEVADLEQQQVVDKFQKIIGDVFAAKQKQLGDNVYQLYKMMRLEAFNTRWVDHLEYMQDVREGIGLQGYAQKDPLVEYKAVAYSAFQRFLSEVDSSVARRFLKVRMVKRSEIGRGQTNEGEIKDVNEGDREFTRAQQADNQKLEAAGSIIDRIKQKAEKEKQVMERASQGKGSKPQVKSAEQKVGRNDPCPCGSGKKYKKCGLINAPGHRG